MAFEPETMAHEFPSQGMILAGKFRVDRVIGAGGMGVVLAVHHLELDKALALKLLRPQIVQSTTAFDRFLREARAASAIESDHVARVIDFGRFENGMPYMAMELLSGEDLSQRLARVGTLAVTDAITMVLQACEALAEAHMLGVVHRDLKPANLFLHSRRDGTEIVKVLDFGISKLASDAAVHLTNSSAVMGSPLYMSPEQLHNARTVDTRTDIWAIGTILYETTTGQAPFASAAKSSLAELGIAITHDDPPHMRQVHPGFSAIVMRCLAKHPAERFQDVGTLAIALSSLPGVTQDHIAHAQRIDRTLLPSSSSRPMSSQRAEPAPRASTTGASSSDAGSPIARPRRTLVRWAMLAAGAAMAWIALALVSRHHIPSTMTASTVTAPLAPPPSSIERRFVPMSSPLAAPPSTSAPPSASALPRSDATPHRSPLPPLPRVRGTVPSSDASASPPTPPRGAIGLGSLTE